MAEKGGVGATTGLGRPLAHSMRCELGVALGSAKSLSANLTGQARCPAFASPRKGALEEDSRKFVTTNCGDQTASAVGVLAVVILVFAALRGRLCCW